MLVRPIELTMKGLHSFREKVTIDFSSLCQGGVFGIFGPTGSGKSSILDAITLSLYGRVDRVTSQAYSIINHAEKELEVTFTFSLKDKDRSITYRVERVLKRTKEQRIQTTVCRLIDVTVKSSPIVIADKKTEVDEKIKELLGLSVDDFTRAVVLPQNKFSEFLKLRGSERRQMLQRLFHLEKYGDELIYELRFRLQQVKHEQEKISAEQQGLGDVSRTRLQAMKDRLLSLEKQWESLQKQQEEIEKTWNKAKEIREWQIEHNASIEKLHQLKQQEDEMKRAMLALERSEKAEQLLPIATAYLESKTELETWQQKREKAIKQYEQKKQIYVHLQNEWKQFEEDKERQLPLLEEATRMIEKVKELQEEQESYALAFKHVKEKRNRLLQEKEKATVEQKQRDENVKKYTNILNDLKRNQAEVKVSAEEKQKVYQALEHKYRIDELSSQWNERKQEKEIQYKKINEIEQQKKELERKQEAYKNKLEQRLSQFMHWYNKASDDYQWLERSVSLLEQRIEQKRLEEMARELATTLKEGEPCPVCGSTTHDMSSHHGKEQTRENEQFLLTELRKEAMKQLTRLRERMWKLEQASQSLLPITKEVAATTENRTYPTMEEFTRDSWSAYEQMWEKEEKTISRLLSQLEEEKKTYDHWMETAQKRNYDFQVAKQHYEELKEKETILKTRLQKEQEEWSKNFPDFHIHTMDERRKKIEKREQEWEKLHHRIEKGMQVVEKEEQVLRETNEYLQQLQTEEARIEQEYKQLQETLKDIEQKVAQLLGEMSLEQLIQKTEEKRLEIKRKENEWTKRLEKHSNDYTSSEKEMHVAVHAYHNAKERWEKAKEEWEKKKRDDFLPEEVERYILPSEKKEELQNSITQFDKEVHHWEKRKKDLEKKLAGESISDEDWDNLEKTRTTVIQQLEKVREERSILNDHIRQLTEKRKRFDELEKKRKEWEHLKGQLEKLDHVFRGKAFVEFLAEEQLVQVSKTATEHLQILTRGRYAIEVDSQGGFIIRDDANGGIRRPISTLSGGETFLTSLALSLALSTSIQLKGKYPLEFFFLDEGFGTLDQELLDTVMSALENLQTKNISVGIISHVPELKERLSRKLFVRPAEPGGKGSSVHFSPM